MRTFVGAALSLAMTSMAVAADLPVAPYYSRAARRMNASIAGPAPIWAPPSGYQWGDVSNNPTKPSGLAGGIEAGYNWQRGQFVYGAETDINLSGADDTFAPYQFSNPWFGTLRGRAGVALGNVLIFGTAGLAYGDLRARRPQACRKATPALAGSRAAASKSAFTPRWSAKAEWLYLDLANRNYSLTGTSNGLETNLLRFGVNYHF